MSWDPISTQVNGSDDYDDDLFWNLESENKVEKIIPDVSPTRI